jgi:hypothetical protein
LSSTPTASASRSRRSTAASRRWRTIWVRSRSYPILPRPKSGGLHQFGRAGAHQPRGNLPEFSDFYLLVTPLLTSYGAPIAPPTGAQACAPAPLWETTLSANPAPQPASRDVDPWHLHGGVRGGRSGRCLSVD